MDNIILRKTLSGVWKLLIIYSIYILLRGHNEPGGGFIGGLILALGLILRSYISDTTNYQLKIDVHYQKILGLSLIIFIAVILIPSLFGEPVLKGLWSAIWVPIAGKFSSVLIFDVAVYMIVASSALYGHYALSAPHE